MAQLDDSISDWIYRHDKGPIGTRLLNRFLLAEPPILTLRDLISHHRGIGYVAMLNNIGKVSVAALVSWMAADGLKFEGNKPATRGREAASMAQDDPSKAYLQCDPAEDNRPTFRCELCGFLIYEGTDHTVVCEFRNKPTLRDQFAMAALTGLLAAGAAAEPRLGPEIWRLADAMLDSRRAK